MDTYDTLEKNVENKPKPMFILDSFKEQYQGDTGTIVLNDGCAYKATAT